MLNKVLGSFTSLGVNHNDTGTAAAPDAAMSPTTMSMSHDVSKEDFLAAWETTFRGSQQVRDEGGWTERGRNGCHHGSNTQSTRSRVRRRREMGSLRPPPLAGSPRRDLQEGNDTDQGRRRRSQRRDAASGGSTNRTRNVGTPGSTPPSAPHPRVAHTSVSTRADASSSPSPRRASTRGGCGHG